MEQVTISPGQALVGHHRPQWFIGGWLRVVISRFMKNMLDRFVIGDPEYVLLLGGQADQMATTRDTVVPYPQGTLDTDNVTVSSMEFGLSCPTVREEQLLAMTLYFVSGEISKVETPDLPSKNVFDSGPGMSDIDIREYLRYSVYRLLPAVKNRRA